MGLKIRLEFLHNFLDLRVMLLKAFQHTVDIVNGLLDISIIPDQDRTYGFISCCQLDIEIIALALSSEKRWSMVVNPKFFKGPCNHLTSYDV